MDIKNFLEQNEIKNLIANEDLDAVYNKCPFEYRDKLSNYLFDLGINPVNYFKNSIPDGAFQGCDSLISAIVSDSITSIGDCAFEWCSNLETIIFSENGQLDTIGNSAFNYCKKLKSINIPNGVTTFYGGAFANCGKLTSITIPDTVIFIGGDSFWGCYKLKAINYNGTKDQWLQIEIDKNWCYDSAIKTVHCIDGDISI